MVGADGGVEVSEVVWRTGGELSPVPAKCFSDASTGLDIWAAGNSRDSRY